MARPVIDEDPLATAHYAKTHTFGVCAITAFAIPALDPTLNDVDIRLREPPVPLPG